MKTAVMLVVAAGLLTVAAYTQQVQVVDKSANDSPIRFSGQVIFGSTGTAAGCNVQATNNSNKAVVAMNFVVDGVTPAGGAFAQQFGHDHFFADDNDLGEMSGPGMTFETHFGCETLGLYRNEEVGKATPFVNVTLRMVQFNDGSTWGDPAVVKQVQFQRKVTIAYLTMLQNASDLGKALASEPPLTVDPTNKHDRNYLTERDITWEIIRRLPTVQAQRAEIDRRLGLATARVKWLQ